MAKSGKFPASSERKTTPVARPYYGRVYLSYGYVARIWDPKGVDIWNVSAATPDQAYEMMKAAAEKLDFPVDLYRHGAGSVITETTAGGLPF